MTKVEMPHANKIRFDRLELVIQKALEQTIKKTLTEDQFGTCFPRISATPEGRKSLELARTQMVSFLTNESQAEFGKIFEEGDIHRKLDELDEIIHSAQFRRLVAEDDPVHIDRLLATDIIDATVAGSKENVVESLTMIRDQLRVDNKSLLDSLKRLSTEADEARGLLEESLSGLTAGLASLKDEGFDRKLDELISVVLAE